MSNPWIKFYPRDWRGDQALRSVSIAARGLWIECLCIMHEAKPYGHLLLNGQSVGDDALARMTGAPVDEVSALMAELRQAGAFSVTREGVIFSRRMTKDHARASKGRKAVQKRWAQQSDIKEQSDAPNRVPNSPPTTQKPEARYQKVKEEPNGSSKKRGSRLPDDWQPDIEFAVSLGLSQAQASTEAQKFREWWPAQPGQKGVKLDWGLTWKTWCRNAVDRLTPRRAGTSPPSGRMSAVEAYVSMRSEQKNEPASRTINHRDAERLPPDQPRLQALIGDAAQALRWPDGSGHH